jgi:nitrate reductase delta subunit
VSLPLVAVLDRLGAILAYPREGYRSSVDECRKLLASGDPEAAVAIDSFSEAIADLDETELEELYTRSFDLNPVCTLEVGWHIYGEQYRRGRFLVQARELLSQVGIDEQGELPDHLMSLLPAVARLEPDHAATFAGTYLVPAVNKMLAGLADKANPYEQVLSATQQILQTFAAETTQVEGPFEDDDLVQIGTSDGSPTQKGAIS